MEGPGFRKNGMVPIQKKWRVPDLEKTDWSRFRKNGVRDLEKTERSRFRKNGFSRFRKNDSGHLEKMEEVLPEGLARALGWALQLDLL